MLIGGAGPLLTSPAINPNVGYDALRDFTHIAMIAGDGYVLISNPASELKTFADARQAGGQNALTVGSPGAGSLGHLIIEQIKRKAGMQLQHVPFRSAGETMTAVLGDHVALAIQTFSSAGEQVRAGKVIGLAVTSDERVPAFKDSPTFAELGLGEIGGVAWFWLTAPAKLCAGHRRQAQRRGPAHRQAAADSPAFRERRAGDDGRRCRDADQPHRQGGGDLGSARQGHRVCGCSSRNFGSDQSGAVMPRTAGPLGPLLDDSGPHIRASGDAACLEGNPLSTLHMPHGQQAERHRRGEVQPGLIAGAELVARRHDA